MKPDTKKKPVSKSDLVEEYKILLSNHIELLKENQKLKAENEFLMNKFLDLRTDLRLSELKSLQLSYQ